jgi:glycosyltransferase involved in cell wall biosynthesis
MISPELLPETSTYGKPDILVEEVLLSLRRTALSVNAIRDMIRDASYGMDDESLFDCLNRITNHIIISREYQPSIKNFFVASIRILSMNNPSSALKYFDLFTDRIYDSRAERTMIQTHTKIGNMKQPLELLRKVPQDQWTREMKSKLLPQNELLNNGYVMRANAAKRKWKSKNKRIMYNASQCLPHTSSGYAIRTHGLVKAIRKLGYDAIVHARHGYPLDRGDFKGVFGDEEETVDSIQYVFNVSNRGNRIPEINYSEVFSFSAFSKYQENYMKTLISQAEKMKPEIMHAASNFVVGMATINAAEALGIPSIYEIRGFWHITQASKRKGYEDSDHYRLSESMEIEVAKRADHVFAITSAIADILVENGVKEDKISILPNAVDIDKFTIQKRDSDIEDEFNLNGKVVLGYVGSFVEYEGLDLLLQAVALIREDMNDELRVILVGDGPIFDDLREMSRFLGINDIVTFTGRVEHGEVQRYYSVIDITAFPRKGARICELVSPLKPFEAMAMGKAVIASDVLALSEIVTDGETGLLHRKDDVNSLADCLEKLISDTGLRERLAANGREWVKENRTWEVVAERVISTYRDLTLR